ncbi:hypothetical protein [Roseibium sp. Sym1]|uniref:hypothetical protein n=1 Tax=Roseibium sp. Sym1 TaxID=3016006 RepID=UPI0022B30C81|nr:hypothetical protein [Roseibium sp. Sym1]
MNAKTAVVLLASMMMGGEAVAAPLEDYFSSLNTCYGRSYSSDHLQQHHGQQVIDMAVSHFPQKQELLGMDSPFQPYPDTPRMVLRLDVWLRGQDRSWQEHAICEPHGDSLSCAIECDGGTFEIEARDQDRLLVKLRSDLYFTQCDAGDAMLSRTAEDRSFLLSPLPRSHCSPE